VLLLVFADQLLVAGWGLEMWDLASATRLMTLGEEGPAAAGEGTGGAAVGPEAAAAGLEGAQMWTSISCAGHLMAAGG
jgi:hypothetical protein